MIRLRHLAGDTLIYGLVSASRSLVGLLLVPIYTRIFLPIDYGYMDILTTLVALLTVILTLGMNTAVAMFFYNNQGEDDRATMLTTVFTLRLALSLGVCIPISLMAPEISRLLFPSYEIVNAVRLAVWVAPATAIVSFFIDVLRLSKRPWVYTTFSVANLILQVFLIVLFVLVWQWGIAGVFGGILGANLLVIPIVFFIIRKVFTLHPSGQWLIKLLHLGLPLVPAGFSSWSMAYAGRYFLLHFCSAADIGLLAVAYKVSAPLALLTGAFLIAWPPFAFSIQKQDNARELHAKTLTYFLIAGAIVGVTISIFSREILLVFTTPNYLAGHVVTGLMAFQLMADTCYYIFSMGLLLTQKTRILAYCFPIGAVGSILFNLLLVPPLGFLGAAIASTLSYSLLAVIAYVFSQREFRTSYEISKVIRLVLLCISGWVVGISIVTNSIWLTVGLKLAVLSSFIFGLFLLQIIDRRELGSAVDWLRGQRRRIVSQNG